MPQIVLSRNGKYSVSTVSTDVLSAHGQYHAKPRLPGDHLLVGFGGLFQRVTLDHWTDAGQRAELHGVLGVFGGAAGPSLDGAASADELQRSDSERLRAGSDD